MKYGLLLTVWIFGLGFGFGIGTALSAERPDADPAGWLRPNDVLAVRIDMAAVKACPPLAERMVLGTYVLNANPLTIGCETVWISLGKERSPQPVVALTFGTVDQRAKYVREVVERPAGELVWPVFGGKTPANRLLGERSVVLGEAAALADIQAPDRKGNPQLAERLTAPPPGRIVLVGVPFERDVLPDSLEPEFVDVLAECRLATVVVDPTGPTLLDISLTPREADPAALFLSADVMARTAAILVDDSRHGLHLGKNFEAVYSAVGKSFKVSREGNTVRVVAPRPEVLDRVLDKLFE